MEVKRVIDYDMDENCYIFYNEKDDVCFLIDPGCDIEKIKKTINNRKVTHILLTHCHYDHIKGVNKIKEEYNSLVVASKNCVENIRDMFKNASSLFNDIIDDVVIDEIIQDNEEKVINNIKIKCIETKGHTDCSVCYIIDNKLYSGDTLFKRSIGRTDLKTGSYEEIENNIKSKLYVLDDETEVFPGHGEKTTIGYEKKFNMFVR